MHINDCIVAALQTQTGLDLQLNDMLLVYYQNNGATSDNLDDAEREFLLAQGATAANENDMWLEVLLALGAPAQSLQDNLLWFWCVNGGDVGGGIDAAFDALTFDPDTYEMLGVKTGTGDLSAVSSSTHYARDHEGVYQQFAANTPVWHGGRCVLTGGAGSLVDKVYADDGVGAPLPEVPWLQHYPAATNQTAYSNDTATWTVSNPGTTASDQIGLTGAANSAFIVTDDITTNRSFVRSATFPSSVLDQKYVYKYWIKKDIGNPNYGYFGGYDAVGRDWRVTFNMGTGLVGSAVGDTDSTEVINDGDWWILMIEFTSPVAGRAYKHELYPAFNTTGSVSSDNTLTGSATIGNAEYYSNKTIEQVRGLGPIFTTTAAVATTATVYDNDIANHDDNAAYYAEIVLTDADHTTNHIEVDTPSSGNIFGTGVGGLLVTTDNIGSINVSGSVIDTPQKVGVVHTTGGQKAINLNGVWGIDTGAGSWTTALNALRYGGGSDYAFKIRGVQRYDDTDYAALKAIIDGLMGDTNLYVNSKLVGGDSPFAHTVGFGTAAFNSTWWAQDYFTWESNFPQDNARAYLNYNVAANNPDLVVGETYRFAYRVRSDNPLAQCLSVSAVTNVTAVYGTRMPGTDWGEVTVDITIDAPGWACTVRCGTGTTATSFQHVQVRKPTLVKL